MQAQPIEIKATFSGLFPPDQQFARIAPNLPKEAPANIRMPQLEKADPEGERRYFAVTEGFVPVSKKTALYLRRIHIDGEPPERGGKGPLLFQVEYGRDAANIIAEEERRSFLEKKGGSVQHAELAAYLGGQQSEMNAQLEAGIAEMKNIAADAAARAEAAEARNAELEAKLNRLTDLMLGKMGDPPAEQSQVSNEASQAREIMSSVGTTQQAALPLRTSLVHSSAPTKQAVAATPAVLTSQSNAHPAPQDPEADVREYVPPAAKHVAVDPDGTVQDFAALAMERG